MDEQKAAFTRVPPHSQEAEESVLGALLIDPEAFDRVAALVAPTDFYVERVDADRNTLVAYDGRELPYDLLVTVPVNMGAEVIARSGVDHVVLNGKETGYGFPLQNSGRSEHPPGMANGGHDLALFHTIPHDFQHGLASAQIIGGKAARDDNRVKIGSAHRLRIHKVVHAFEG